ncbi:MAG: hypothetical protein E7Z90_01090 [Cyanobacteria bacterium SIG29]|nr:hypothetical protein [Cyanobacteria bacterium SIG29]
MKIFYIELNQNIKKDKKKLQSALGHYLTKNIAKTVYGVKNSEFIIENSKPKFKTNEIEFNISHSNNIVTIAFDNYPLGLDVEQIKNRNLKALKERYNLQHYEDETFFQFWTQYEAKIKIQAEINQKFCFKLKDDYMLSLYCNNLEKKELELFEIKTTEEILTTENLETLIFNKDFNIIQKQIPTLKTPLEINV